jgi:hypothetical protein
VTVLRTLRKLVLGETWTLPLGVGALLLSGVALRALDAELWREAGGVALLAGVIAVQVVAVAAGTGRRPK